MSTAQFSTKGYERTPGPAHALAWMAAFTVVVALLGGSARFDAVQLAALRPLAALFLIPALYWMARDKLVPARAPLVILLLAALWTGLQLVPLPPSLWQALPGREAIAAIDATHGLSDTWRPVSWVPMRGWNALFELLVPLAALLLALSVRASKRSLLSLIVALGVADALLGLAQIAGGSDSLFYFYTHTNAGAPTGLFANENHSGVFSALVLLVIARLGFGRRRVSRLEGIGLAAAFLLVCLVLLGSGSRAALGLGIVVLFACGLMAWIGLRRPRFDEEDPTFVARLVRHPRILLLIGFMLLAGLIYTMFQFDRLPGLTGAISQNAFEDLRWRIAPILWEMIATHWMVGTGFGSFDAVYLAYEPTDFQGQAYLNQAHNDWAQIVIEGGLPAIILLLALGRWLVGAIRTVYSPRSGDLSLAVFWVMALAVLAVASVVDYPLRTPLFQVVCGFLVAVLALDTLSAAQGRRA